MSQDLTATLDRRYPFRWPRQVWLVRGCGKLQQHQNSKWPAQISTRSGSYQACLGSNDDRSAGILVRCLRTEPQSRHFGDATELGRTDLILFALAESYS
jgi:hypothetical protein